MFNSSQFLIRYSLVSVSETSTDTFQSLLVFGLAINGRLGPLILLLCIGHSFNYDAKVYKKFDIHKFSDAEFMLFYGRKRKMMLTYTLGCSLMFSVIENPFFAPTLTVFSVSSAVKFTVGVAPDSVMSAPAKDGITVTL